MKIKRFFIHLTLIFISLPSLFSQVDYSDNWEDFFSYNNVKDFFIDNNKIYAVCDNAIFIYDEINNTYQKKSSVQGLSGETASSFFYSNTTKRIVIGYKNGLIEIINPDGSIHVSKDIVRLNINGEKSINNIIQYGNKLYISTSFAILEYDINNLAFGDTFYIGDQSTSENIHQIAIHNNTIYAATEHGIYYADLANQNLIDFNNWQQPQGNLIGNFKAIKVFNDKLYTVKNKILYELTPSNTLLQIQSFSSNIVNINSSFNFLNVSLENSAYTFNNQLVQVDFSQATTDYNFELNNSFSVGNSTYLATKKYGVLLKTFNQENFEEIHPEGPLFNSPYSMDVYNNNLWVVYGGQAFYTFNGLGINKGFSHFNGENWLSKRADNSFKRDLISITIDKNSENTVYISSWKGGLFKVVDDQIDIIYNNQNSGLENRPTPSVSYQTAVSSSAFDSQGNLWVANGYVSDKIKKFDTVDSWVGYNFDDVIIDSHNGLGDVHIDANDNKLIESRLNGVFILDRTGTKTKALNENANTGDLPDNKIKSLAIDKNNKLWIGTLKGLVRFDNMSSIFTSDSYQAKPIIIKLEGGTDDNQGQILLGDQPITAIAVDGADNKWFGTTNSGVLGTNPNGQKTLSIFNKDNSPLPSNNIADIKVDDTTGKVYFATSKGIVAYNNKVAPFGENLGETYAYPNPCTKENDFITIDGRHGTHLPRGTNIKILDSAGYLVYETNVLEGIEVKGGKAIWNKQNLAGRKVASGVYIIMLSLPDKSETSITKVAIIN